MAKCLICSNSIEPFISFGKQPIANGFLTPAEFANEYFFELKVAFCPKCHMVQLTELVDQEKMFHDHYAFFSSTSQRMAVHFREFAELVRTRFITDPDPFVVEIGSNDGIMLRNFASAGIRHLGIEPSSNVAEVARKAGVRTISEFFDEKVARRIVAENGPADAFMAANVMCHIPYQHSVVEGIKTLLKPTGVAIFEDPYLGDVIEKTSYDQFYDEHPFMFSLASISHLFEQHGMEVVDVLPQPTHGGSMRYAIGNKGKRKVAPAVAALRERETALGLAQAATFDRFRKNCEKSREDLMAVLRASKKEGKRVVGYAATSKSTTVTNYCGITPDLVEYISDTTPIKQGKYSPGVHIPVKSHEEFTKNYPDRALLFGWNHAEEIMAKEKPFRAAGGQWIVYVPKVEVIR